MINLRCQPAYLLQAKAKRPAHACWPALQAPLPHPATSCMIRAIADTLRAALVAGVTATVSATAGALIAFTGDVSLPNLRLTGCDGGRLGRRAQLQRRHCRRDRRQGRSATMQAPVSSALPSSGAQSFAGRTGFELSSVSCVSHMQCNVPSTALQGSADHLGQPS